MTRIVYCPKCNSENIKYERLTKPEPERVSMDEWARQTFPSSQPLVLRFDKWQVKCADCGYAVDYQLPASNVWGA